MKGRWIRLVLHFVLVIPLEYSLAQQQQQQGRRRQRKQDSSSATDHKKRRQRDQERLKRQRDRDGDQEKERRQRRQQQQQQEHDHQRHFDSTSSSSSNSVPNQPDFQEVWNQVVLMRSSSHGRPRSIVSGMISGIKSVTIGTVVGLGSFVGFPAAAIVFLLGERGRRRRRREEEDDESNESSLLTTTLLESSTKILLASLSGMVTGVLLGIPVFVVCGIHAAYSILMGTVATPFTVAAVLAGMDWDPTTRHWIYYTLEAEVQQLANYYSTNGNEEDPIDISLYQLLEVSSRATPKDIKRAYYTKAKHVHPDKNPTDSERAAETFLQLHSAYQILSDPERRATYDQWGLPSQGKEAEEDGMTLKINFCPRTFFIILFGSQQVVEQYTGELSISTLVDHGMKVAQLFMRMMNGISDTTTTTTTVQPERLVSMLQQLYHQPRKRQVDIALNLVQKLSTYPSRGRRSAQHQQKHQASVESFRAMAAHEAQQIAETPFGWVFLFAIGSTLQLEAAFYGGGGGGGSGGLSTRMTQMMQRGRNQKRLLDTVLTLLDSVRTVIAKKDDDNKNHNQNGSTTSSSSSSSSSNPNIVFSEEDWMTILPDILAVAWAYVTLDITHALKGACRRLFLDASISRTERQRRAQGLAILAEEFLQQGARLQDVNTTTTTTTTTTNKTKNGKRSPFSGTDQGRTEMAARVQVAVHAAQRKSQGEAMTSQDTEDMIKAQQRQQRRRQRQ
jgi:hypothetical protein